MSEAEAGAVVPDTKDWTWTLERPCPDCGFVAGEVARADLTGVLAAVTAPWAEVLRRPDATARPAPSTWSPLEYGCHVRDVCRLFDERVRLMQDHDDPTFDDWDQDATAVRDRYGEQDPAVVAAGLAEGAAGWGRTLAAVPDDAWERTGRRSNGSLFTVLGLGRYGLHDLAHHLHDVGAAPVSTTS
ncbi:DinB family protein [Phycicoccus duodecadis]|uniref:DinB family protein n=1 Tax=Phycicoccus duodecadis TaxID=173053 RepID=A0A2N3YJI9_9MICO|nr:DinB family protein [Phycicoccus duodecadis]PKW27016.1 DinB family protein [Phycicoccus duodecadis]